MEINPGNDMKPSLLAANRFNDRFDGSIMNSVPNLTDLVATKRNNPITINGSEERNVFLNLSIKEILLFINLDSGDKAPLMAIKQPTPTSIKLQPYISVLEKRRSNEGKSTAKMAKQVAINNDDIILDKYGNLFVSGYCMDCWPMFCQLIHFELDLT
ncbi:hypothetical protein DERP_011778 [Dermatophagoides pteronyssinus]|uniref:Uncharacterized protein n=1 Tax=Dermatophagoides pteronyssinus TaxID=6956 RepID=A0ABQ8JRN2_DERPT|nr:hypothetical protein DERP_011778 [Dermatophagoides pteronyssinus]